jgi:GntR family transcriptional regulator, transcriptional repressor for pyruvate dehydrogenase complex
LSTQITKSSKLTAEELKAIFSELAAEDGSLPPEREMVDQYGVPRTRLRRVLSEMREEGLLPPALLGRRSSREMDPQTESLVRLANPNDVIELRIVLEPYYARLAALRASSIEIARITKAAQSDPEDDYGTPDIAFHLEIASASRNALAREFYRMLRKVGADSRVRLPSQTPLGPGRRQERDEEHMRIANAIAKRDPDGAEEAMRAHLAVVHTVILERMSPDLKGNAETT